MEAKMKVIIDPDVCMGCGVCEGDEPDVFQLEGAVAVVILDPVPEKYRANVLQAIEDCPEQAITIKE
jgi:ferredoxin